MSELSKKVAYLKGYVEGLGADFKSDEGKIIEKLLDVIDEMATEIEVLSADVRENSELIDEIDETLLMVADDIYGDDEDDDYDLFDEDDDEDFGLYDEDEDFEDFEDDEELEDENSDLFEIQCPECNEDFMIDYDEIVDGSVIRCPHCEKRVELDIDFDDIDDDEWSF